MDPACNSTFGVVTFGFTLSPESPTDSSVFFTPGHADFIQCFSGISGQK